VNARSHAGSSCDVFSIQTRLWDLTYSYNAIGFINSISLLPKVNGYDYDIMQSNHRFRMKNQSSTACLYLSPLAIIICAQTCNERSSTPRYPGKREE